MMLTEWNTEEAKTVWFEEGREEGREDERKEIAITALAEGLPMDVIQKITGLDTNAINELHKRA